MHFKMGGVGGRGRGGGRQREEKRRGGKGNELPLHFSPEIHENDIDNCNCKTYLQLKI